MPRTRVWGCGGGGVVSPTLLAVTRNDRLCPQQYGLFGKDRGMLADDLAGLLYQHRLIH